MKKYNENLKKNKTIKKWKGMNVVCYIDINEKDDVINNDEQNNTK